VFLAWDSTDLVPARRMMSFGQRWALLRRHLASGAIDPHDAGARIYWRPRASRRRQR
jgi:hypothetical protein